LAKVLLFSCSANQHKWCSLVRVEKRGERENDKKNVVRPVKSSSDRWKQEKEKRIDEKKKEKKRQTNVLLMSVMFSEEELKSL